MHHQSLQDKTGTAAFSNCSGFELPRRRIREDAWLKRGNVDVDQMKTLSVKHGLDIDNVAVHKVGFDLIPIKPYKWLLLLTIRHTLFPWYQQLPPAVEQQCGQEEAQPEASEPHRGGPGQHPQCSVQERPHTVARRLALLHRLPGQSHVLLSALP